MLRFASLGSGSKGNATLVSEGRHRVLIDCGFSVTETVRRLARLGVEPQQLDAVFLTHEHSDHSSGVSALCRKYQLPLYTSWGTHAALQQRADVSLLQVFHIACGQEVRIGGMRIEPVTVPHDAREPLQFLIHSTQHKLGILTDLGSITSHVVSRFTGCTALLLECNHDLEMLHDGPYPPRLKQRVSSDWGHLSNDQAHSLLQSIGTRSLRYLVLAHISEQNNSEEKVLQSIAGLDTVEVTTLLAKQNRGFDWLELEECLAVPY